MKYLTPLLLALTIPLLFTGCWDQVKEEADLIKDDVVKAAENIKEEFNDLSEKFNKTKDKVVETAEDIEKAKNALDEVLE
jgi:hypothetical protein